jgi:RNA polymerase sigma-70 factor, ECF subfamily
MAGGKDGPSDNELIARVVTRGDQYAFAELVKRHQSVLRASIRKMTTGSAELADDVAQETFVLAWRNISAFRFEAKFSTWLYRIAFNVWQSEVRKKSEVLLDDEAMPEPPPVASHAPQVARQHDLANAMHCLSDAERAAINACFYADLSHDEAAYALGMPLGTLKTHVLRAKEKLRQALRDYDEPIKQTSANARTS